MRDRPPSGKELDAVSAPVDLIKIFREDGRVDRVVPELSAHEERAPAAENAADHRHVQIIARCDVRNHQSPVEEEVGKQEVVDVAADGKARRPSVWLSATLLQPRHSVYLHAIVDLLPEPGEQAREDADGREGHVQTRCSELLCACPALSAWAGFSPEARRWLLRTARLAENLIRQSALVGEIRAPGSRRADFSVLPGAIWPPGARPDWLLRAGQFPFSGIGVPYDTTMNLRLNIEARQPLQPGGHGPVFRHHRPPEGALLSAVPGPRTRRPVAARPRSSRPRCPGPDHAL